MSSGKRYLYHMIEHCVSSMKEENPPKALNHIECGRVESANMIFLCARCYTNVSGCLEKPHLLFKKKIDGAREA